MQIRIVSDDGVPIYIQIVNQVKHLVASGRLAPGDEMPSIRVLAAQLTVNPNTIVRAYLELEQAGIVTKRNGTGTYVSEVRAPMLQREKIKILASPGSAGHFVKMVHNGIEYGIMQLTAETYDLMKRGWGMNDDDVHEIYASWNKGELNGYLVEITSHIFSKQDEKTGKRLIDEILNVAQQNGTGLWTSQSAMELQVPSPTIDLAVAMRDMSVFTKEREQSSGMYQRAIPRSTGDRAKFLAQLSRALFGAMITIYAQGFALMAVASAKYKYDLDLEAVARIWRGGCIIRAALLEDICAAFRVRRDLPNLLLDPNLARKVMEHQEDLRQMACQAIVSGVPAPAFMVSLGYLDAYRSAWQPANLIQAQRDYFGSHTYERIDAKGTFHTEWEKA